MPDVDGVSGDQLRSLIERVERLEIERKQLREDIKEVYSEAKGAGYDVKIMRRLVKERSCDPDDLQEEAELLRLYKEAISFETTPLGQSGFADALEEAAE